MTSPLNPIVSSNYDSFLTEKEDDSPFHKLSFDKICHTTKTIAKASTVTALSLIFIYSVNLISLGFVTAYNDAAIVGGLGLGFVTSNCFVYILITSINQGVNALAAQAFGAKRHKLVALNYHRGLFLVLLILVPVLLVLSFTVPILVTLGIEPVTAQYAWDYIKYAYPSYFFYGIFDCTKSYLYAQRIFRPILYTQTITTALHILWAWLFISKLGFGCVGAGIAKNIYEFFNMISIFIYIIVTQRLGENWVSLVKIQWRKKVLKWKGVKTFLKVVIPIAALLFLDMACYEIFAVLAGQFGNDQLSVHVAIANSATIYYSIPLGLSVALMTFVANAMGEGMPNAAKNFTFCGLILNIFATACFVIVLWVYQVQWADLFSPNETVKIILLKVLFIYLLFIFFDGIQVTLSGTMKGIGKQNVATVGLIISYYLVALPLIYWFAFRLQWKVAGIWSGFLFGIVLQFIIYLAVLAFTNFKAQTAKIRKTFSES